MPVINLSGVLRDGTGDMVPSAQRISWPRGEAGTINISVTKADGTAYDLTGCTLALAMRPKNTLGQDDGTPLIARAQVMVDAPNGAAKFVLVLGDTASLLPRRTYRYDVNLTDAAGARWQIVPESDFRLEPIVSMPGDPTSAP